MKPWKIYLVFQGIVTGLQTLLPTGKITEHTEKCGQWSKIDVKNNPIDSHF